MTALAWSALAAFAVLGPANWWGRWAARDGESPQWQRWDTVTKPLATIAVVLLAAGIDAPGHAKAWCAAALVLCLVGDVALLRAVDRFVVGLGAFLLGHLVFVGQMVALGLDAPALAVVALVCLVAFGAALGRRIVTAAASSDPALRVPVAAYLGVITVMAVFAWWTGRPWALVGALAFVVSDTILGWGRFVRHRPWMPLAVMMTYHLALVGLTLSLL